MRNYDQWYKEIKSQYNFFFFFISIFIFISVSFCIFVIFMEQIEESRVWITRDGYEDGLIACKFTPHRDNSVQQAEKRWSSRWRQRKTREQGGKIATHVVSKIESASLTLCYKLSASLCSL